MQRSSRLVLAVLSLALVADSSWRLIVDSCRAQPYEVAMDRLQRLADWHPVPHYALTVQADLSWDYVQREKSLAAVEYVWGLTRGVWLRTGRDSDRARAAWLTVMLQLSVPGIP